MIYCMSDIHGMHDRYLEMLKTICFSPEDTLYVIGDVIDRGPHGIETVLNMMSRSNVILLRGNHEQMCLDDLYRRIPDARARWQRNGVYHFIWSEGGWTNGTYRACASHSTDSLNISPDGKVILDSSDIANGPEHISYINISGTDEWRMVCHRRIIGDLERGHRMLCIDDLRFDGDEILPVQMT